MLASLSQELAARQAGIQMQALVDNTPPSPEDLIDLIETCFHAVHRRELPTLIAIAERMAQRPSVCAPLAVELLRELRATSEELEVHMAKEEQLLFPLMRKGSSAALVHAVSRMRSEHDEHTAHLARVDSLIHRLNSSLLADADGQLLQAGLAKLSHDMQLHFHLENCLLFPQFAPHRGLPEAAA